MTIALRGASATSFEALVEALASPTSDGADSGSLASDLFGVAEVLEQQPGLRRVVTDVSIDEEARGGLMSGVFGEKVGAAALGLVAKAATLRWAAPRDLIEALEQLAVVVLAREADRAGEGDRLEDDLFAVAQLIQSDPELRNALSDRTRSTADKQRLAREVLDGKVTPATSRLAEQAVARSGHRIAAVLEEYADVAAAHRGQLAATIRVARPLSEGDRKRLEAALSKRYDKHVHTNVVVDPDVVGGVRVEVGDEVIDGTIASRLDEAGRRLAG